MDNQQYGDKPQPSQLVYIEEARGGCCDCPDTPLNGSHVVSMRIVGVLCILFGIVEFGVGGAIHNYLSNITYGAWWSAILAVAAGITAVASLDRKWVVATCVFASIAFVMCLVGTVTDGPLSTKVLRMTACSSNSQYNYGDEAYYAAANECEAKHNSNSRGCYCVDRRDRCSEYILSRYAVEYNQNCGNILGNYANLLAASTAICALLSFLLFILSIMTCSILCSSQVVEVQLTRK